MGDWREIAEQFYEAHGFGLNEHLLMLAQTGSHAYNLNTEGSDQDYTAVIVPPEEHLIGLSRFDAWHPQALSLDVKVFSVKKMFELLLKGNPNSLELLYLRPQLYTYVSPIWVKVQAQRDIFLSQKTYHALVGWAEDQVRSLTARQSTGDLGQKRKDIIAQHGYDTKATAHVYRLLFVGLNLLTTGTFDVWMEGAQRTVIREVRAGKYSLDGALAGIAVLTELLRGTFKDTALPCDPDRQAAASLLVAIHRNAILNND